MTRTINVGLLGCGVVGQGIVRLLAENREAISRRLGADLVVQAVVVRSLETPREGVPASIVHTDAGRVLDAPEIDVVVEVMGGISPAEEYLRRAIAAGKQVVSANKALIAERGESLIAAAESAGVDLYFEAAVGGGIPIIRMLREAFSSDQVDSIRGIVNGTSNYILSRMQLEGIGFETALREAQAAGYAEADPTLDVSGGDAAHKLAILTTMAFGSQVDVSAVPTEGIERVTALDVNYAGRFGFVIKPLAVAKMSEGTLELRVHPALVPQNSVLANISGALNAVYVEGRMVGPCLVSGLGAGALPTAVSVVSDIVDVSRNILADARGRVPLRAFPGNEMTESRVLPSGEHRSEFYLRFSVRDRPGILARIAGVLGSFGVSIEQMVQDGVGEPPISVVMITHDCRVDDLRRALREIGSLTDVVEAPRAFRIER